MGVAYGGFAGVEPHVGDLEARKSGKSGTSELFTWFSREVLCRDFVQ